MGLALVLVYIALNLLSPGDLFPALGPYRPMLVLGLVNLPPSLFTRLQAFELGKLRTQFALVMLFFVYATASWIPHRWFGGCLVVFIALAPNILAYFLGVVQFRSPSRLRYIRATLVAIALFVMVNAFREIGYVRATGEDMPYVMPSQVADDPSQARIRGLGMLHDPNTFGQFLLLTLPLLFVSTRKTGRPRYLIVLPLVALLLVGVYYTGSRGTMLGLAVLIGLYLTGRFKGKGAAIAMAAGFVILMVVNATLSRSVSLAGGTDRLAIWSDGMQYFKSSPLWGIGIGGFMENQGMTAHNSYLLCAAELGMLGYFLWMAMMVVTLSQLKRVPQVVGASNPELARWAVALKLSLSVYMFTSFFLSRTYELPLFMLLGMAGSVIAAAGGDDAIPLRGTNWQVRTLGFCVGLLVLIYAMLRLRVV